MSSNRRSFMFAVPLLSILGFLYCSDENNRAADLSVIADRTIKDRSADLDKPGRDSASEATVPDGSKADKPVIAPDQNQPDQGAGQCVGVTCTLLNDCCTCRAYPKGSTLPVCPTSTCKQHTCGAIYLVQGATYCLPNNGRCYVTDAGTPCSSDKDCQLINNCCDCLSLPTKALAPPCSITACFAATCTAHGIALAKARCVAGLCKLGL